MSKYQVEKTGRLKTTRITTDLNGKVKEKHYGKNNQFHAGDENKPSSAYSKAIAKKKNCKCGKKPCEC